MPLWTLALSAATVLLAAMRTPSTQEEQARAVALAERTLRQELALAEGTALNVGSVEAVDWRDSSLGCPEPGHAYLTALVPGYRVVLQTAGALFAVHVGGDRAVVCKGSERQWRRGHKHLPERVPPADEIEEEDADVPDDLSSSVIEDLAERLEVEPRDIELVEARELVWSDGSLGCPEPGVVYEQSPVPGYRLKLRYGVSTYDYRVARSGFFKLCETQAPARRRDPRPGGR